MSKRALCVIAGTYTKVRITYVLELKNHISMREEVEG